MVERFLEFFAKRHLLTNLIFITVIVGGIFSWRQTQKEEMPDVTFNFVRISVAYPGAPAADVEYYVSREIEEKIRGLDGVHRVESNSSVGQSSVRIELEQNLEDVDAVVTEIRNTVADVRLPAEVIDDPGVRVFKTSKKAILDVALYHTDHQILNIKARRELQSYVLALENRLLTLPEVHSVNRNGFLQEEIQVKIDPAKLVRFDIPFNKVQREVRTNHVRQPAGSIEAHGEPKVTLLSELDNERDLKDLAVQGGFSGNVVRLGQIATIERTFAKNKSVMKVNGYEAVMMNVVKSGGSGILESREAVLKAVASFRDGNLKGTPVRAALLDDESIDVRNRLRLITVNGTIGFFLILAMLFIFLNPQAGVWVALGIPFTLAFTMIVCKALGFTINGTTLAAVIIVMGIVVDDAIVVAENITRLINQGVERSKAVVQGAAFVMLPIFASIVTTCIAFIPLFFFTGHFAAFIKFIPPIIFLMLGASLFESLCLLPGHMALQWSWLKGRHAQPLQETRTHWFERVEDRYGRLLQRVLPYRWLVVALLTLSMAGVGWAASKKMKFVMFPNEETRDIVLTGMAGKGLDRFETARKVREIEELLIPHIGKEVVGFRTNVARSRRGGRVQENQFRMLIEIVPKEERERSADAIVKEMETQIAALKGFNKVRFRKSRWGSQSGSPIEIHVQQNNDVKRKESAEALTALLEKHPGIKNPEIDEGHFVKEYRISINREKIKRLAISAADVASTFRAALEGTVLYEFSGDDEQVRVRLTTEDEAKTDLKKVLSIPVENQGSYLVPLGDIVSVTEVQSPTSIWRRDNKRTIAVFADLDEGTKKTPLDLAAELEATVFPELLGTFPTTSLQFGGEVQDTRDSKADFANAAILALLLIYAVLAVLFDSTTKPLLIMLAIPFGVVGVVLAFMLHGKLLFGFYAGIGILGLAGVVINDSIVMVVKLDEGQNLNGHDNTDATIAKSAQTRLRAVLLTTLTTVAGVLPTAYGWAGYDAMLAEMMLALSWGLIFGTLITLVLVPCLYSIERRLRHRPVTTEGGRERPLAEVA
jgi:multidrug efflux pump subunit AcrB